MRKVYNPEMKQIDSLSGSFVCELAGEKIYLIEDGQVFSLPSRDEYLPSMKHTLKVRIVEGSDLCPVAPFLPEDDEYEMYLNSLNEDISQISAISGVVQSGSVFYIETISAINAEDLKRLLRPVFTESIMKNLRFVSLAAS